ncbi:interferon gamma-like [Thalassophryne amazonica]|uniref:interferon gamma-like n=1 Tax=Thalassophryne amazonica TaxID=390379 RepID=UPI0014718C9A|nr:interferon gamma-like [Thalassophryne amazonica]
MVATVTAVVCLSVCLCACQIRGMYIPPKMNRTIHNLLQHYKISTKERFNGNPVFSKELLKSNTEDAEKRIFVSSVLETYENMIGQMLNQLSNTSSGTGEIKEGHASTITMATAGDGGRAKAEIREELNYILKKVQDLRILHYQQQKTLLQELQDVRQIKMDNFIIQSKSLWELPWLYEKASSLAETSNHKRRQLRRRKRRQTQRAKRRPKI